MAAPRDMGGIRAVILDKIARELADINGLEVIFTNNTTIQLLYDSEPGVVTRYFTVTVRENTSG